MSTPRQELSAGTMTTIRDIAACCAADPHYAPVLLDRLAHALAARARDADDTLAFIAGYLLHVAEAARADIALADRPLATGTRAAAGER